MTRPDQDASELHVFQVFAQAAGLDVVPESVQKCQPPKPDIECDIRGSGKTCFELVEIVDSALAVAVNEQLQAQEMLGRAAEDLRDFSERFSDALIFVRYTDGVGMVSRRKAIRPLFDFLEGLPDGFTGVQTPSGKLALSGAVDLVRVSRGNFVGPSFQVEAGLVLADPLVDQIEKKLTKTYDTTRPIELVAWYSLQPTPRVVFKLPEVEELVKQRLGSSPFSRVWIVDVPKGKILFPSR